MHRHRMLAFTLLLSACSKDSADAAPQLPERFAAVADWAQGTVSVVDYDALIAEGATRESATVHTIDLSGFPPGPIDVAITPDRKQALVSCSSNFFVPGVDNFLLGSALPAGGALSCWSTSRARRS